MGSLLKSEALVKERNMGYHHNPIEPSDWSDGPDYLDGEACESCGGAGECMQMVCYGGLPTEEMRDCPDCGGTGTMEPDNSRFDDDVI